MSSYPSITSGWRPLNGIPRLRVAVWSQGQSPMYAGLSLRLIGCTPALSVTQSAAAGFWRYISDVPLPLSTTEFIRWDITVFLTIFMTVKCDS